MDANRRFRFFITAWYKSPSTRAEIAPHALAALCAMVFVAATLGGLALKVVSDQRRRARTEHRLRVAAERVCHPRRA